MSYSSYIYSCIVTLVVCDCIWVIIAVIIMFLACCMFGNGTSNPNWWRFSFHKQPCRKTQHGHIPGWQCQDSSGSSCERMVVRERDKSFLQLIESLWDVRRLNRVLDSCIVNTIKVLNKNVLWNKYCDVICIQFWSGSPGIWPWYIISS